VREDLFELFAIEMRHFEMAGCLNFSMLQMEMEMNQLQCVMCSLVALWASSRKFEKCE